MPNFEWCNSSTRLGSYEFGADTITITKILKGIIVIGVVALVAQGLVAFWQFPFNSYTALANREGLNTRNLTQLQEESLRLPSLLGISTLGEGVYKYDYFFFAAPVLILFFVGGVLSVVHRNKKVTSYFLTGCIFVFLTTVPIYVPFIASTFKFFFTKSR